MLFYLIRMESGDFSISPATEGDKPALKAVCGVERLKPGLPLAFARHLLTTLKSHQVRDGKKEIIKLLRKFPGLEGMDWRWEPVQLTGTKSVSANINNPSTKLDNLKDNQKDNLTENQKDKRKAEERDFTSRIKDRQLSEADLQRLANEMELSLNEVILRCEERVQRGLAEWVPAVRKQKGQGWRCLRCGETKVEEWPSIYGLAATCPSCAALGALSSLQAFYRSRNLDDSLPQVEENTGKIFDPGRHESLDPSPQEGFGLRFSPHWTLSQAQELASREVLEYVSAETSKPLLLWAACGAGKTEVCFPAAAWALQRGKKVLFAAPRQDVVLDVAPRLERDFPGLKVSVLTGNSPERFATAPLVLATTHQVLRFYQAFDLIFMDEVDAFPYHGNNALAWGLKHALKPQGKIVYLTATPSPENMAKVQKGEMLLVRLPARYHRKPLPVPEWVRYSGTQEAKGQGKDGGGKHESGKPGVANSEHRKPGIVKPGIEVKEIAKQINSLSKEGPVLVFVPKISWVSLFVQELRKVFPDRLIEGSYSSDPRRREKIERLRKGEYPVFVSTSILERGVTVPKVQVIVVEADHEVFDERGLVQMAGRVGRTRENPTGRALFLAKQKTPAIEKAIQWIVEQNRLALEKGLID